MILPKPIEEDIGAEELVNAFYQGDAGNCAAIAPIKAALIAFNKVPIFTSVEVSGNEYVVEMRDGPEKYMFNQGELDQAIAGSKFKGEESDLLYMAHFMFAAMCKRAQTENNDGQAADSFEAAIESLNNGENWKEGPGRLGLNEFVELGPNFKFPPVFRSRKRLKSFTKKSACLVKSWKHVWFSSEGIHDWYGKAVWRLPKRASGAIAIVYDD